MASHAYPYEYPDSPPIPLRRHPPSAASDHPTPPQVPLDAEVEGRLITEHEINNPALSDDTYLCIKTDEEETMDCYTCRKVSEKGDDLVCVTCARNLINPLRVELSKVLLEKGELEKKVNHVLDPENFPAPDEETKNLAVLYQKNHLAELEAEKERELERQLRERVAEKQKEAAELRARAESMKSKIAQRRANLATVETKVIGRKQEQLKELKEKEENEKAKGEALHNRIIEAKATLCREVASLLRLRQVKKKTKDGAIKDRYFVAGLMLPNLREINSMRCTELTAVLGNAAFIVYMCSYYIGIKLPSEMTVPHRDYPLTTIMTPAQSYLGQNIAFPGSGSALASVPASPSASRFESTTLPRPRPLFIGTDDPNESVAQYAKKDPVAFNFFLEGIALLAYNVAWFSRSQGFTQGTDSWEEICDVGRILYDMILAPPQSAAVMRVMSQRDMRDRRSRKSSSPAAQEVVNAPTGRLGAGSHTSMHDFYLRSEMSAATRTWRFTKYNMVADPLKKHLLNEMNNAEWEILDQEEWDDGGEKMDEAVFVKTRAMDGTAYDDARSIMTTTTKMAGMDIGDESRDKGKGKSGWTKVRGREKP